MQRFECVWTVIKHVISTTIRVMSFKRTALALSAFLSNIEVFTGLFLPPRVIVGLGVVFSIAMRFDVL